MTIRRMFEIRSNERDHRGNQLMEIAMPALADDLEAIRRVLSPPGAFELAWRLARGETTKSGTFGSHEPVFRVAFERGIDPDGVWTCDVEAVSTDGAWRRPLWRQLLFVQKDLRHSHDQIDVLARRYAPIFLYSRRERYFPVSLQTLLCSEQVRARSDAMTLKTFFGKEVVKLPELGEFLRFNGHSDYLLDFNFLSMRRSVFASIGGDPRNATIYYSTFQDPDSDRFFITYHQIYAYDTKTGLARWTGIGPHVFDRESMILVFDGDDTPTGMIISGHLENQTIFFLNRLKVWTQGRIRVPFDDPRTLKLDTHPVIAVAEGSHALYPTSGVYQLSLLKEIAGHIDSDVMPHAAGACATLSPDQVLIPPGVSSKVLPTYRLSSLGLDRMTSHIDPAVQAYDTHNAFLCFSGYWVDVPGTTNARFPPFTKKVSAITDWVDGAYAWHWDDVPDRFQRNNRQILRYLRENLEDF